MSLSKFSAKEMSKKLKTKKQADAIKLKKKKAVDSQDYELAARLRDEQMTMESKVNDEIEKCKRTVEY